MNAVLRRWRGRRVLGTVDPEAGAAMLMVVMLMLVIASLGLIVTASVVGQVRPTVFGQKSTRTVFAAEAGVQAGLTQVRTATRRPDSNGVVRGEPTELPCAMTGEAGLPEEALRYDVTLTYYNENPVGKSAQWRADPANRLACTATGGVEEAPAFALVTSRGSAKGITGFAADAGDRQIESLYRFSLVYENIPGGLMFTYNRGFCLEAGSATVGSTVRYIPAADCVSEAPLQSWRYDPETDYAIKLASTVKDGDPGLCLSAPLNGPANVTLQKCVQGDSDAARRQLLSYHGGGLFKQQNELNTDFVNKCLNTGKGSIGANDLLKAGGDCSGAVEDRGAWAPEAKVGSGEAGWGTRQIVNFGEFGRCFDITNENAGWPHMILYPCKQDPSGAGRVFWNHKLYYAESPAPQQIKVYQDRKDGQVVDPPLEFCVTRPAAGVNPGHVRLSACVSGSAAQLFVRNFDTGNRATNYTFTDTTGTRCLAVGPKAPESYLQEWSTVVSAPCDGSAKQKWNAPSISDTALLSDTRETDRTLASTVP